MIKQGEGANALDHLIFPVVLLTAIADGHAGHDGMLAAGKIGIAGCLHIEATLKAWGDFPLQGGRGGSDQSGVGLAQHLTQTLFTPQQKSFVFMGIGPEVFLFLGSFGRAADQ